MPGAIRYRRSPEEVGSGVNDNRKKLEKLVTDKSYNRLVVEHKDRLTRFSLQLLKMLAGEQGRTIEIVNEAENDKDDLMEDFIAIITSFCARLYGLRRSKRKTEKIVAQPKDNNG